MMTRGLLILGAVLVFGGVNWQMEKKEQLRYAGQTVYLELAPVDPRSLMQGDYMALNFALVRQIGDVPVPGGVAILKVDGDHVGTFSRMDRGGPLGPGEVRFRFRMRRGSPWLGTNAFFFHEGEAERYRDAKYGEFRVGEDGEAMLVNLVAKDLQKLILIRPGPRKNL
jgi:uncharacterized membrane-anchored protein